MVLLDLERRSAVDSNSDNLPEKVMAILLSVVRETDITGWYIDGRVAGAMFTELPTSPALLRSAEIVSARLEAALRSDLGERHSVVRIYRQLFPQPGLLHRKKPPASFHS